MSLSDKIQEATYILKDARSKVDGNGLILFSGGKDSIVAADLAKKVLGIRNAFSEVSLLPLDIANEIKHIGSNMELNVRFNNQLPPKEFVSHWFNQLPPKKWKPSDLDKIRHWKSMPKYAKENNIKLMVYGRRLEENTIPKPFYFKKTTGIHQVHPIYNWTREEVFEYLHTHNLEYPSCYKTGAKHLFTIVSLAQNKYKETRNMNDVFDIWTKYGMSYMKEAVDIDNRVSVYMKLRGYL